MIQTFSESAMRTIKRVIRNAVAEEIDLRQRLRPPGNRQLATYVGKVATTVTARSGTTPGNGTVTLQASAPALSDATGVATTLETVTAYSLLTSSVAVGEYVVSVQDQLSGNYWIVQAVASGVSGDIQIKNNTGAVIPIYNILAVDSHTEDPETDLADYQANPPTFNGNYAEEGSPGDWGSWCVLQAEAAIGATVPARITGLTPVEIDKRNDYAEPFVDVDSAASSTLGRRRYHGCAEILSWKNFTTDEGWAWLRMGKYQSPLYRAIADEEIVNNGSGDAIIQYDGAARDTVTLHNKWMEGSHHIQQFDELLIKFNREEDRWIVVSAEC